MSAVELLECTNANKQIAIEEVLQQRAKDGKHLHGFCKR